MKLIEIVGDLASFDNENTIYASEPWSADCEAIVAAARESKMPPDIVERRNMKYFLEVFIARDFLDDWTASLKEPPTLHREVCEADPSTPSKMLNESSVGSMSEMKILRQQFNGLFFQLCCWSELHVCV